MGKFAQWESFILTIALTTTLAIWILRQDVFGQSRSINLSVAVIGTAALTVPFQRDVLLRNSGLGLQRLMLLVGGLVLMLMIVSVAQIVIRRGSRDSAVRLLIVGIAGILIGNFSVSIPGHVIDYQERTVANPSSTLDLLASLEVREVSEWLKLNTDQDSIIASNYFCHVGKTCPSDTSEPIRPSMWGFGNADMSNLAAYSERRFYVQAFRHIFGNARMPDYARTRVRQSLDAATSGDLSSLLKVGVSYFVLDRASAPTGRARMSSTPLYENSRFSVYSID